MRRGLFDPAAVAEGRRRRKAESRAKLLGAARTVFAEKGLERATARDIVRRADLSTGTFYNHFEDKEQLFRALLEEIGEKSRAVAGAQRREPGQTLEERFRVAFGAYFGLVLEERELFLVLRRNSGLIGVAGQRAVLEPAFRELVEELVDWAAAGDLPDVDRDYLAGAMVGTAFQVASRLLEREPADGEAAAAFCTRLLLSGVGARPEPALV